MCPPNRARQVDIRRAPSRWSSLLACSDLRSAGRVHRAPPAAPPPLFAPTPDPPLQVPSMIDSSHCNSARSTASSSVLPRAVGMTSTRRASSCAWMRTASLASTRPSIIRLMVASRHPLTGSERRRSGADPPTTSRRSTARRGPVSPWAPVPWRMRLPRRSVSSTSPVAVEVSLAMLNTLPGGMVTPDQFFALIEGDQIAAGHRRAR